jgi:peptidyl-prolyl cis-trans isomerase SurA
VQVVTESSESCDDLAALAQQAGSPVSADFGESPIAALPENLREPVLRLRKGETTDPIDLPNGVMAVMVCERRNPTSSQPEPEVIRRQLEAQRFEVLAQRYLRDLRQSAFVETRV